MRTLDRLDRRILYELDYDSRQSLSALARKVRQGRDRVEYRLERLTADGVLRQCSVTINPYRLGLTLYKTYLKVEKNRARYKRLLETLRAHPRVFWLADCDGRWDLIFSIFARSPFEFRQIQTEILAEIHDLVVSFNVYTLVNIWMFRKNYLIGEGFDHFFVGGAPESVQVDELEWAILKILAKDARMTGVEIARRLRTTETIVRHRIQSLESSGVIAGYRVDIDLELLGMMFFKAQLYLHEHDPVAIEKLREYCAEHPNITYYIEQIGECELELELEVNSYLQFTEITNELRERFPKLIRNVETNLIHQQWYKWVPHEHAK